MKSSCLPGCAHMNDRNARTFASFCHWSPGILASREPLPCTTSSWLIGNRKLSLNAYKNEKVMSLWWSARHIGFSCMYCSESCIQPMFHLRPNPRPPPLVGCVTPPHDVDSSAIITMPGLRLYAVALASCKNEMASRFSRPPFLFGTHSPSLRE